MGREVVKEREWEGEEESAEAREKMRVREEVVDKEVEEEEEEAGGGAYFLAKESFKYEGSVRASVTQEGFDAEAATEKVFSSKLGNLLPYADVCSTCADVC
jgi:hypothetical protein